jgi:hypothetical protein
MSPRNRRSEGWEQIDANPAGSRRKRPANPKVKAPPADNGLPVLLVTAEHLVPLVTIGEVGLAHHPDDCSTCEAAWDRLERG